MDTAICNLEANPIKRCIADHASRWSSGEVGALALRDLALARQHEEVDLAKQITDVNHFHVRLTNMVRDSACAAARSFLLFVGSCSL